MVGWEIGLVHGSFRGEKQMGAFDIRTIAINTKSKKF